MCFVNKNLKQKKKIKLKKYIKKEDKKEILYVCILYIYSAALNKWNEHFGNS